MSPDNQKIREEAEIYMKALRAKMEAKGAGNGDWKVKVDHNGQVWVTKEKPWGDEIVMYPIAKGGDSDDS